MLFTTAPFLLLFLPITLAGFLTLGRWSSRAAIAWLLVASVFFYGYWAPQMVALLLASVAANYLVFTAIARRLQAANQPAARRCLTLGIVLNLLVLGYFKYANFFVDNLTSVAGTDWHPARVILPIGISFYSFTQIAFLVDAYQGKVREPSILNYGLFVTYFPHLVAGPVLHHAQMMPQFADRAICRPRADHLATGLAILALGMFKKVILADGIAPFADALFQGADGGAAPTLGEAWLGAIAYALQLYFDFSGYSDMAIGLSLLFNVRLPFNFDSPYRARNISDFWRCWHMSLSNFLRDYLYIPLGGNRKGGVRRYFNLALTMVLGGLWHGAGWTFVVWGALHGLYLMVNHGFRAAVGAVRHHRWAELAAYRHASWALTLLAVLVAWVFFRAESLAGAVRVLTAMVGLQPTTASESTDALLWNAGLSAQRGWLWCALLGAVALFGVNSNRLGDGLQRAMSQPSQSGAIQRSLVSGAALALLLLLLLVNTTRQSVSAFIYFNF